MLNKESLEICRCGEYNRVYRDKIMSNLNNVKCYYCGRKVEYEMVVDNIGCKVATQLVSFRGRDYVTCRKCFWITKFFNDIVCIVVKTIRGIHV
jgi:hypothetical protein